MFDRTVLTRTAAFLRASDGGLKSRMVRSGFWVAVSLVLVNVLQLSRSVILARLLTPEIFGMMAICLIVIRAVELFSETGMRPALIHRRDSFEQARDTAFCIAVGRGFVLAGVAAVIAPAAAWYYDQPLLVALISALGLSFIANGFTNLNSIALEKQLDFRKLTIVEQTAAVGSFVVIVSLAYYLRSIWALAVGHVLGAVFGVLVSYLVVPGRPRFRFDRAIARELLGYGRFVTGLTIVIFLTTELDNLVVGKILGMDTLGFYLVAYTLANLPTTHLSKVLSRLMFPAYSIIRDDPKRLASAYIGVLKVVSTLSLAAAAALIVLAEDIVRVVYGPSWVPVAPLLRILAVFGAFRAIGSINGYLYNAIGKPEVPFYLNLAKLVVILAAIVPATVSYGAVGTAVVVTVPTVLFYFASVGVLSRVGRIPARVSLAAVVQPLGPALAVTTVLILARTALGPVGAPGLLALLGGATTLSALLNASLLNRLYREHWRRSAAVA